MARVIVMDWQRVLLYHDGKLDKVLEPGRHKYNKNRCHLVTVDMRPRLTQVQGQELITIDGVSIRVSLTATWHIVDPVAFTTGAQSTAEVLHAAIQTAIRDKVAHLSLETALADRSVLSQGLDANVAEQVASVGIAIDTLTVRDLMLPGDLRRAAMDVVLAKERGKATLEEARAEAAALRSLKNVAALLEQHPALLSLRTLQIAAEQGTTLVVNASDKSAVVGEPTGS